MAVPLVWQIVERPVTSTLAAVCTGIWLWLSQKQLGYAEVGLNYERFVHDKQFWRIVTSQFSHVDFIHLVFNMASLWSIGFFENGGQNSIVYLQQSLWLLVGTGTICLGIYTAAIELLHKEDYRHHLIVGYSGVIFGWMALLSARGMASFSIFGVLELPMSLAPFGALIITSIIVPRVSFIGHLSGIIMGYFIAFVIYPITTNRYCSLGLLLALLADPSMLILALESNDCCHPSGHFVSIAPGLIGTKGVGWSLRKRCDFSALNPDSWHLPSPSFPRFSRTHQTGDIETGADVALLHDEDTRQPPQH